MRSTAGPGRVGGGVRERDHERAAAEQPAELLGAGADEAVLVAARDGEDRHGEGAGDDGEADPGLRARCGTHEHGGDRRGGEVAGATRARVYEERQRERRTRSCGRSAAPAAAGGGATVPTGAGRGG